MSSSPNPSLLSDEEDGCIAEHTAAIEAAKQAKVECQSLWEVVVVEKCQRVEEEERHRQVKEAKRAWRRVKRLRRSEQRRKSARRLRYQLHAGGSQFSWCKG